mgnify:CR=1 FL=1
MPNLGLEVNFKIRVIERGRPIQETIKVVQTNIKHSRQRLDRIKDTLLTELNDYINAHRKREKERHQDYGPGGMGRRAFTRENNLFNTIKATSYAYQRADGAYIMSIGEYRFLDQYAPYWYLINYGGRVPNEGQVVPGYFGRGEQPSFTGQRLAERGHVGRGEVFHYVPRWKKTSFRKFFMIPMKPIAPMYYLNYLARRFEEKIRLLERDTLVEK